MLKKVDTYSKKCARADPSRLINIRKTERASKRKARNDTEKMQKMKTRDRISRRKRRTNSDVQETAKCYKKQRCHGIDLQSCIQIFFKEISVGPLYVCSVCEQTWFKHSVIRVTDSLRASDESENKCLTGYKSVDNVEWICRTCYVYLKDRKIPKLSLRNKMGFLQQPEELKLHPLEERLISPRIPFMRICELPRGNQFSLTGMVVNVPVDVSSCVYNLPRNIDDTETVPIKLKRKLQYKTAVLSENVRPVVVVHALQWLLQHGSLYKDLGIKIDPEWLDRIEDDSSETTMAFLGTGESTHNQEIDSDNKASDSHVLEDENMPENDGFSEIDETEVRDGNFDTLLDEGCPSDYSITIAPGEGERPMSLYKDKNAEYLSFPSIFCGETRPDQSDRHVNVPYSDICKWELRSVDRRVAMSVPNIFFKLKKTQMKQISDKVSLVVRRGKKKGQKLTVGSILNSETVEKLVNLDEGYHIFRTLRNSPPYLESRKKDLFACIRQLGLPTWFISLSAADTKWPELLKTLGKLVRNIEYTDEDIEAMDWNDRCDLIQKDPVTCARFFDHRVQTFIHTVLRSHHEPIGHLIDSFYRVEFQKRGSPHIHALLWIDGAPDPDSASCEQITEFIDTYVSCSRDVPDELQHLLQLQLHRHSKTCRKKGKAICRFNFPIPPMSKTMVLEPLTELDSDQCEFYTKAFQRIGQKLDDMKEGSGISFEDFLNELQMTEECYILAIRSSLAVKRVFLRRTPNDIRVNSYMKNLLSAWRANHDIQYVLDAYACAMYIVAYISKAQRGMSLLLDQACREARETSSDIRKQVRHIGNKFLSCVEISAQEAAYLLLQIPLTKATRQVQFINTSPADERTFLVKSKAELEQLDNESTDIESNNIFRRYSKRPKELEHWCLADYASKLTVKDPEHSKFGEHDDSRDENGAEENNHNDTVSHKSNDLVLEDGSQFPNFLCTLRNSGIYERQVPRVIRFVKYSYEKDSENFCREKLLLYVPWRDEKKDLTKMATYEELFNLHKPEIEAKMSVYEKLGQTLDDALVQCRNTVDDDEIFDHVAPVIEHMEADDLEAGIVENKAYAFLLPDSKEHATADLGIEFNLPSTDHEVELIPERVSEDEYREMVQKLNKEQREFFTHVLQWVKTKDEPLYAFLSGGAGVGKSHVIRTVYQSLHRYLCSKQGENPDDIRILMCAPTGKAAYHIHGITNHAAFKINPNQGFAYTKLDSSTLNSVRVKYRNLKVVLMDEVSMVGFMQLNFINLRLQEIKGNRQFFGGVSVIFIGDLFQLKPVFDTWIFKVPNKSQPAYENLATNIWNEVVSMHELQIIMRQQDDKPFANTLNRLREGKHTAEDIASLEQCVIQHAGDDIYRTMPHVYPTVKKVDNYNNEIYDLAKGEKLSITATDAIVTDLPATVKKDLLNILSNAKDDPKKTSGLLRELHVAIGLQYDLVQNLNVEDGLVNGASCTLQCIEYDDEEKKRPKILWVEFSEPNIGIQMKKKHAYRYQRNILKTWVPILGISRNFNTGRRAALVSRTQFPLRPSAARTVHKCQGSTMNEIVVDLSGRQVEHIHYVALSRVTKKTGLHVIDLNATKIAVSDDVTNEMCRLRKDARLKLCYTPVYCLPSNVLKVVAQNARSFHKHFTDIAADPNFLSADIILISESRLMNSDDAVSYALPHFSAVRNDQSCTSGGNRPAHGLVMYLRDDMIISNLSQFSCTQFGATVCEFHFKNKPSTQVCHVYMAPKCPTNVSSGLLDQLQSEVDIHEPLIIIGDFNKDVSSSSQTAFVQHLKSRFEVQQLIAVPTTDYGSILDLVFTNIEDVDCGVIECSWSDHKTMSIAIPYGH